MAFACLTTSVKYGYGTIAQLGNGVSQGCNGEPRGPLETSQSCAFDYEVGTIVQLEGVPLTANGWVIEDWEMTDSNSGVVVNGFFNGPTAGELSTSITMPSFDVDVTVSFTHHKVSLILIPMTPGGGCIQLITPTTPYNNDCHNARFEQLLPAIDATVGATSERGWQISSWTIDGVDQNTDNSTIPVSLNTASTFVTVRVWFSIADLCDTNDLSIVIVGSGSVSPPAGAYCEDDILILTPIPAFGYFFKGWIYDTLTDITENGITLVVPMSSDRSVTAIFESIPDFEIPDSSLFYCPSTTHRSNVVSFNFSNNDPSDYDKFHFRVNFYSDSVMSKLVYSASSLADNKRWFYNYVAYEPFPSDGLSVVVSSPINIVYDPEILPQQITETQDDKPIGSSLYETPLICGVKYYIEVESYDSVSGAFSFLENMSLILDCDDIDSNYWGYNEDENNWICSGQGKSDLQVSSSSSHQSIFSSVSSNIHGLFQIVWQSMRDSNNQVYGAIWDSELDHLYSSGQGGYDNIKLTKGYAPIVFEDHAANFFIAGHATEEKSPGNTTNDIYIFACPLPVFLEDAPYEDSDTAFAKLCAPGINNYLSSSYDQIKMRVVDDDVYSSLVVNSEKVVPVVNKRIVNLDVDGIVGAYAVRLRNMSDEDWGGWINIDNNLYYSGAGGPGSEDDDFITPDDISYSAYRIDNSRFIVPWGSDEEGGLRRICCQVLTMYGITNTFCMDIFFNFDIPHHVFEFYSDQAFENPFPTHSGKYILSLKNSLGEIQDSDSTVYFKVVFNEPTTYENEDLKFNVIQQGVNDLWGYSLTQIDSKNFKGSFDISKEDGVFNKDGDSFIEVIFPGSTYSSCLSDSSDKYNLMVSDSQAAESKDSTPEEVYNKILTNKSRRVFDINRFKQYYDQDDSNFKFGNPNYFRK